VRVRVLIFEPDFEGHHFLYAALTSEAMLEVGARVVLVTSKAAPASRPFELFLAPLRGRIEIDASLPNAAAGNVAIARQRFADLRGSIAHHRPEYVCIPYADGLAQLMGISRLFGRRIIPRATPSAALLMRGTFVYRAGTLRKRLAARASWSAAIRCGVDRLYLGDPVVYESVPAVAARPAVMPEPIAPPSTTDRQAARESLGVPLDGRYVACTGLIDRRKGCDLLIRAFAEAKLGPADRLLLVGQHDDAVRRLLAEDCREPVRSGRIVSVDRFVSTDELGSALAASDLVCTPYPHHIGSASIVLRAAAADRPVLGSDFGWVKWAINRFALGSTCPVEDIPAFAAALELALRDAATHAPSPQAKRLLEFHTPTNFKRTWAAPVSAILGLPPPALKTWEWVERGV
jgi:glycosyltransferase involved in cell wall biosynthesis